VKKIKLTRATWRRKPETQTVPNKKAVDSKLACRKGSAGNRQEKY